MIFTNRVYSFFFFKEGSIEYGSNEFRVINYNYLLTIVICFRDNLMISMRNKLLNNPIEIAFGTH